MSSDQEKEKKNAVRNIIIIVTIIVTLVVAVLPFIFPGNKVLATICLGILASIIASLIFSVFSLYVLNDPDHEEEMGAINELNNGVNKIASSAVIADGVKCDIIHQQVNANAKKIEEVNSFKKIKDRGLRTIRSKEDLDHKQEFWLNLVQNYDAPLDIASRTLSPWLKVAYREKFLLSIEQRLNNGHHVHLLIQKPNSDDIKKLEVKLGKNISKSAGDTLSVLKLNIWGKLTDSQKELFKVKVCESIIPYIYIDNGQSVTISPYMASSKAQGRSFLVVFDHTSQYIEGFDDDFSELLNDADDVDWRTVR